MHHFKTIGEFKLAVQSGNPQFGSKSVILCPLWPWNLTNDIEKNKAPFVTYFELYAPLHSHWWVQTWFTVRKRPIYENIGIFLSPVTLKFNRWPWKTKGHLFYATSNFVHHFIAINVFKLVTVWKRSNRVKIWVISAIVLCDPEIWQTTFKNQWDIFPNLFQALCFTS